MTQSPSPEQSQLAQAIRRSLEQISALPDDELCARDAHMHQLFQAVADGAKLSVAGQRAFHALSLLTLGTDTHSHRR